MTKPLDPLNDYISRECEPWLARIIPLCPILSIMGPRQAGKTRLIKNYFPHLPYYDFEDYKTRKKVRAV